MSLILILGLSFSSKAQENLPKALTGEQGKTPRAVIDKLWEAMRAKNFETIRALFTAEAQLVSIEKPRDGGGKGTSPQTRVLTVETFAKTVADTNAPVFNEKMPQPKIEVLGDLATVSGRYTFYIGDKFSHCGTNTFNLVRTPEAGWRIIYAVSTLEFQCEKDLKIVEIPVIEANSADVSTIEGVVKAFYEGISGGKGVPRQWSRDKTLYIPDVRFVSMSEDKGKIHASVINHNQYVSGSNEFFVQSGFTEREISRVVRRFGNIAHVFSVYEYSTEDKKISGRGVNSMELFWDGKRWWISAVSWDEERPNNPIPKEFLVNNKNE